MNNWKPYNYVVNKVSSVEPWVRENVSYKFAVHCIPIATYVAVDQADCYYFFIRSSFDKKAIYESTAGSHNFTTKQRHNTAYCVEFGSIIPRFQLTMTLNITVV